MAPRRDDLIEICTLLAEEENLQATVVESAKGALIAGFGALTGGLLGGPFGLAIGGTVGSITAAFYGKGKYKSVVQVINEMNPMQKRRLADSVRRALNDVRIEDVQPLMLLVLQNNSVKEVVLKEMGNFLMKELSMSVVK